MLAIRKICFSVFIILVLCVDTYGNRLFHSISTNDGLSDVYVSSIVLDDDGYAWIATNNGLNRFDGYHFRKYSRKDMGYTFDAFSKVSKDGDGNIWVFSSEAIFQYDHTKDCLTDDLSETLTPLGIPCKGLQYLSVDSKGNLWGIKDKIYFYDFAEDRLETINKPKERIVWIESISDECYHMSEDGLLMRGDDIISVFPCDISGRLRFYVDKRDCLWVFCPVVQILKCYNPHDGIWSDYNGIEDFHNNFINAIVDDGKGNLWFGTNSNGIIVSNYAMGSFLHILSDDSHQFSLPSNHINCLYVDGRDNIWLGTSKKGFACCPLNCNLPETFDLQTEEDVSTIIEDDHGRLWIGTDGKGLIEINEAGGKQTIYSSRNGKLPSDLILGSFLDNEGNLFFSTYGGGVLKWNNRKYSSVSSSDEEFNDVIKFCREILKDRQGNLWVRTFSQGICCLKPDGSWSHYTMQNSSLKTNHITTMTYSEQENIIYIGTSLGLYSIPILTGVLQSGGFQDHITELYSDSRGFLWIGTIDGLFVYDRYRNSTQRISSEYYPFESNILGITSDNDKNIWVTSSTGVTNVVVIDDPSSDSLSFRCYPYFEEDGIGEVVFGKKAIYRTRSGDILLGAGNKLLKIVPERPHDIGINTKVLFTTIQISGKRVRTEVSSGPINLEHTDYLTLDVSAMDFPNRHRISYEYRFSEEDVWVRIEGNRIHLSNLNSGNHNLYVRATGPGINCPAPSVLSLTVKPPFWKSKEAFIIYMAVIILLIILIYLQLRAKNRRVLAMERHEMDELKLQFFTNICHDLRTPLTLILTPLNRIMRQYDDHPIMSDLQIVERNAQILMNEVNQLLDFRKFDKDKLSFCPTYGDFCQFVQQACEMFNVLFSDNNSCLMVNICRDEILMDFDHDKMQRVLFNLLSNAYKYNSEGGKISVSVLRDEQTAVITVADNGIGIKDECKPYIFDRFYQEKHTDTSFTGSGIGLHIVKEYVSLHDGTVDVQDNAPCGSVFTVRLPIRGIASATQLPVSIPDSLNKSGRPSILIVEDNDEFRHYISECLSETYDVIEASDGRVALEMLDKFSFNIVITDIMMPVMNGMELCGHIKGDIRYSHIPVIMLTAVDGKNQMIKGLKEGADEYIIKPFDYEILMVKIEKLLALTQQNRAKYNAKEEIPSTSITLSKLDSQLLDRIIALIEENIANTEYSVEDLSKEIGISRSGLYKKLMFITGKSPIEFIRIIRLRKGRRMIDDGEMSISQIAWSVGISPKQFAKYFRQEFGCLPSEYIQARKD